MGTIVTAQALAANRQIVVISRSYVGASGGSSIVLEVESEGLY